MREIVCRKSSTGLCTHVAHFHAVCNNSGQNSGQNYCANFNTSKVYREFCCIHIRTNYQCQLPMIFSKLNTARGSVTHIGSYQIKYEYVYVIYIPFEGCISLGFIFIFCFFTFPQLSYTLKYVSLHVPQPRKKHVIFQLLWHLRPGDYMFAQLPFGFSAVSYPGVFCIIYSSFPRPPQAPPRAQRICNRSAWIVWILILFNIYLIICHNTIITHTSTVNRGHKCDWGKEQDLRPN